MKIGPHELKLIDTTIEFLKYISSILLIILSASGAAFYYYYTNKLNNLKLKHLSLFAIPAVIVGGAFYLIGYLYSKLIAGLAEGSISEYVGFWFKYAGYILWGSVFVAIVALVIAFIIVHKKA